MIRRRRRPLAIGRGRLLREGTDVAILSLGARLDAAMAAAQELAQHGIEASVADARFCKPLDTELVEGLARNHPLLVTVEDGAIGGFATHVLHHLAAHDLLGTYAIPRLHLARPFRRPWRACRAICRGRPRCPVRSPRQSGPSCSAEIAVFHGQDV